MRQNQAQPVLPRPAQQLLIARGCHIGKGLKLVDYEKLQATSYKLQARALTANPKRLLSFRMIKALFWLAAYSLQLAASSFFSYKPQAAGQKRIGL